MKNGLDDSKETFHDKKMYSNSNKFFKAGNEKFLILQVIRQIKMIIDNLITTSKYFTVIFINFKMCLKSI